jgi:hypothetical protein
MFKKLALALAVAGALVFGVGSPSTVLADRGHHHHHRHHHGHWHGHHHGHWHGHWRRPIIYPPIYIGGYYPVRTYYPAPYYYPYGYYGSGVSLSVGW